MSTDAKLHGTKQSEPLFAAKLMPHRSLSPKGRKIVIGTIAVLAAIPGLVMSSMGAWPVIGFMGLDVLAVWAALTWSTRDGKRFEQISLWSDNLEVLQVSAGGKIKRSEFNPFYVRLIIERDFDERTTAMHLRTKEGDLEIGAFLNPPDKASFARAFGTALRKARS